MPKPRLPRRELKSLTRRQVHAKEFFKKVERDPKSTEWIQWHRKIRRGQLTGEELNQVRQKLSTQLETEREWRRPLTDLDRLLRSEAIEDKVALHLTDLNFLESILKTGLREGENEISIAEFNKLSEIGGVQLSWAADTYREALERNSYYEKYGYGGDRLEIRASSSRDFIEKYFKNALPVLMRHSTEFKCYTGDELNIIRHYLLKYKKGDLSFLDNDTDVFRLKEIMARTLARRSYFVMGQPGKRLGSSMGVGLVYSTSNTKAGIWGDILDPGAKPIGLYVRNHRLLPQVLDIMLRNAKSIDGVLPIYVSDDSGKTVLAWPKKKM